MPEISFLGLDRGYNPTRPPRSLQPQGEGAVWRNSNNGRFLDGYVKRRPSMRVLEDSDLWGNFPTEVPVYPVIINNTPGGNGDLDNGQIPIHIFDELVSPVSGGQTILVTSREIWRSRGGTWDNLTPTYSVGTIDVTGVDVTINTGTPLWSTRHIQSGNLISINGGTPVVILSGTDTTLTLDSAPGDAVGASYIIERNFVQYGLTEAWTTPLLARLFNADLYVAGRLLGSDDLVVYRVQECFSNAPTLEYLAATVDPTNNGTPVDDLPNIGDKAILTGLELLNGGEVVISTSDEQNTSRLMYSSGVDQKVWDPAAFTDLVGHDSPLRTIERFGASLSCHFDDGVTMGHPTGQASPPLNFQQTRATSGALGSGSIHAVPGGSQAYISRDYHAHIFDGTGSQDLGGEVRRLLAEWPLEALVLQNHVSWNDHDDELSFWLPSPATLSPLAEPVQFRSSTVELVWSTNGAGWSVRTHPSWIGAVSDYMWGYGLSVDGRIRHGLSYAGVPSVLTSVTNMLYKFRDDSGPDVIPSVTNEDTTEEARRSEVESDDVMAEPGKRLGVRRISIIAQAPNAREERITCGVSYDSGHSWTDQVRDIGLAYLEDRLFHFEDLGNASDEKFRVRVRWPEDGDTQMRLGQVHVEFDQLAQDKSEPVFRIEDLDGMEFWCRSQEILIAPGELTDEFIWGITDRRITTFDDFAQVGFLPATGNVPSFNLTDNAANLPSDPNAQFILQNDFELYFVLSRGTDASTALISGNGTSVVIETDGSMTYNSGLATPLAAAGSVPVGQTVVVTVQRDGQDLIARVDGTEVTIGNPQNANQLEVNKFFDTPVGSEVDAGHALVFSEAHSLIDVRHTEQALAYMVNIVIASGQGLPPVPFPPMPNSGSTMADSWVADSGVTITGSGVSEWKDGEAELLNLVQGVDAERPTFGIGVGNRPVLIFSDIADQHIKRVGAVAAFDIGQPWTWIFVIKFTQALDNDTKSYARYSSGSSSVIAELRNAGLNTLQVVDTTLDDMQSAFEPVVGVAYSIVIVADGATSEMFVDGVSVYSGTFGTRAFVRDDRFRLGNEGNGVDHELSECRVIDGDVRDDMAAIDNYFNERYGI